MDQVGVGMGWGWNGLGRGGLCIGLTHEGCVEAVVGRGSQCLHCVADREGGLRRDASSKLQGTWAVCALVVVVRGWGGGGGG